MANFLKKMIENDKKELRRLEKICLLYTSRCVYACGIGTGKTILAAYRQAFEADPVSIFGGIVVL
ncbi:phosphoribosylaminoimidazolecarboxamide formyltransferase/IMP cyclohydrolase, partial [Enterococcus faecalis]